MDNSKPEEVWEKRVNRERLARLQAEKLLEEKSLALFEHNEQLLNIKANLEQLVKQRTVELEDALNVAQQANIAKREFFANISHELRTPLNGIIGMTTLLNDTNLNNIQKEFVNTILVSSEILLSLINDILDFSKIEAGKLELEQIEFNLHQLVFEILDILSARVNEKNLNFYYAPQGAFPCKLIGDPNKLKQIIINLCSNAVKFTEKGEVSILIELRQETNTHVTLHFGIKDSGIGIPQEKVNKLFTPFTQADASTSRKFGGTGLGLSISKKLVEMMDGEVGIISAPGQGSTFHFTANFLKQNNQQNEAWEKNNLLAGHTVYLVEDCKGLQNSLKTTMENWGLNVLNFETLQSINLPQNSENNLLIVGNTLEHELLKTPNLSQILQSFENALLLSKEKNSVFSGRAKAAGFNGLMFKPIKYTYLFNELCLALNILVRPEPKTDTERPGVVTLQQKDLKVLIVEDNLINQKVVSAMLAKNGYSSKVAGNGIVALQMMQEEPFDLVFMDFQMPELDGYETTLRIRSGQHGKCSPYVPIIAMTANAMKGDQEKCLEAGMNDFLPKPLIQADLVQMLETWGKKLGK